MNQMDQWSWTTRYDMPRALLKTGTHRDQWFPPALDHAISIGHTGHKHQNENARTELGGKNLVGFNGGHMMCFVLYPGIL